jgi:hypothetical protein
MAGPGAYGFGQDGDHVFIHAFVGPDARSYVIELDGERVAGEVRDGAFLAFIRGRATLDNEPEVTLEFADGSRRELGSGPLPGAEPPRPELPDSVPEAPVRVAPRRGGGTTTFEVTFRATVAITDFKHFWRAEINGPAGNGRCKHRGLGATNRNVAAGDRIVLKIEPPVQDGRRVEWCKGTYRGRVALNGRRELGRFTVTVR